MTSEIRANTLKNRVGLGTVSFTNTGAIVSGIVTANSFSGPISGTTGTFSGNVDINGDLDVDGHTELDNVNIVGVTTHNGTTNLYGNGGASVVWGNTGYTGHLSFDGSNNAVIRAASGKALIFQTNHVNERLRITSDGKIGIGHHIATQINSELTIRPANDGGILLGRPGDTVAPINKALTITTTTTGSEAYHTKYHTYNCNSIFATYEGGGTGGNFIFKTGVGSGQEEEKLRITSDGKIGIGTDGYGNVAPLAPLHVSSYSPTTTITTFNHLRDASQLLLQTSNNVNNSRSGITFTGALHSTDGCSAGIIANHENVAENSESTSLSFYTSHNESLGERLRITSDGAVRVLDGGTIELCTSTNNNLRGYIGATETDNSHLVIATSGGEDIAFKDGGMSGTTNMIIRGDGKVQIGSPPVTTSGTLNVKGNAVLDDGTNARITLQADGTSTNQILSTTTNFGSYCNMKYQAADHIFQYGGNELVRIKAGGEVNFASDAVFTNSSWTGNKSGKIQHHNNYLYIQGGTSGIALRNSSGSDNAYFDGSKLNIEGGRNTNNDGLIIQVLDTKYRKIQFAEATDSYAVGQYGGFIGYDAANNNLTAGVNDAGTAKEGLRINRSSGMVSMPQQPTFHAYGNNSWTQYTGSNNIVKLLNSNCNVGGHYKTSGSDEGKFVCPVAGNYFFYLTLYSGRSDNGQTDNSDYLSINFISSSGSLSNNGGHHIRHYYNEGDRDSTSTLSIIKTCTAGEKIHIMITCNGTGYQIYGGHSGFGGYLIG